MLRVEAVINRREHLRKDRIHPIDVLKVLKIYESGVTLGRSKKTWNTVIFTSPKGAKKKAI